MAKLSYNKRFYYLLLRKLVYMNEEQVQHLKNEMAELQQQLHQSQQKLLLLQQKINVIDMPSENINVQSTNKTQQPRIIVNQNHALENFIGLKIIHLVGIVVLLIGISISVKYAIDKNLITPLTRITLAYLSSAGLFILSLVLKKNYNVFSAILFSGAMVSAYFTSYGAFVYYNLFSETVAFILMIVLAVFATLRSLKYNLQEIAILAMVGAYAIPLLISSNHENYVLLFSYILLMNTGILYVSFRRSWNALNLLALLITWTFFVAWLFLKYHFSEKLYALIFLAVYYVLFIITAFAFNISKQIKLSSRQLLQIFLNNLILYLSLQVIYNVINTDKNAALITACCAVLFLLYGLIGNKLLRRIHRLINLITHAH